MFIFTKPHNSHNNRLNNIPQHLRRNNLHLFRVGWYVYVAVVIVVYNNGLPTHEHSLQPTGCNRPRSSRSWRILALKLTSLFCCKLMINITIINLKHNLETSWATAWDKFDGWNRFLVSDPRGLPVLSVCRFNKEGGKPSIT